MPLSSSESCTKTHPVFNINFIFNDPSADTSDFSSVCLKKKKELESSSLHESMLIIRIPTPTPVSPVGYI